MAEFIAELHGKLGRKPHKEDARDIRFSLLRDVAPSPVKVPARFGHGTILKDWGMLGNGPDDTVYPGFPGAGDCVPAHAGHTIQEAAKVYHRAIPIITGKEAIDAYSAVTGYKLGDPNSDLGTDMRQFFGWWRNTGFKDGRGHTHQIGAYVALDPKDFDQLMEAAYVFGFAAIGFDFPDSAWKQFDEGMPWDPVPGARSEGGHCVPVFGRSSTNVAGVVSWAKRIGMTRKFYEEYNEETWAVVFPDELKNGKTERGWDLTALVAELKKLGIEVPTT